MEALFLCYRAWAAHCRIVLLSGSRLGYSYQHHHGRTDLPDGIVVSRSNSRQAMEAAALGTFLLLGFGRRCLLALLVDYQA